MDTDLETVQARHHRRQTRPTHDCPDQPVIGDDMQFLIEELAAARGAVERLTENDEDLRASAEIWCRLYEAALDRASACEEALARSGPSASPHAQTLYDALQRVADLTGALGGLIRECALCAKNAVPGEALSKAASDACARCSKALEALARPAR